MDSKIDILSVTERTKSAQSLSEKMKEKYYIEPKKEIHDYSGIRVTAYLESDVQKISDLIKKSFNYHPDKSLDKTSELGVDRMGYRSIHFVCDLGKERSSLPEYAPYKGLLFEIQVRTVLQHAWAEIEHDRSYKFAGILPTELQRRLYVAAGTLEMVDREFDAISKAIDDYKQQVAEKTEKGELDIDLNTASLSEFITTQIPFSEQIEMVYLDEEVISELHDFGIHTLGELKSNISNELIEDYKKYIKESTAKGFLRAVMMYVDIDRYFEYSWKNNWTGLSNDILALLIPKYGQRKVEALLEDREIDYLD